jgi:large subunit ribosomal protein L24
MQKLKVGDTVQVMAGAEASEKNPAPGEAAQKKTPQSPEGGIVEKPGTIALANVQVVCAKCDKPTRVGFRTEGEDGKKKRFCKNCDALID